MHTQLMSCLCELQEGLVTKCVLSGRKIKGKIIQVYSVVFRLWHRVCW